MRCVEWINNDIHFHYSCYNLLRKESKEADRDTGKGVVK